ncbi:contractile injection system tape measure protein [Tenacibaculum tangerinum]|uniref:Contractile injection system tape measure protein n=1 Tax=Tenacibaculum tangerinum TaxID=3038772 RepID=A0ABY8KY31_9FLAO|nr:contractile injection system tape measure protein [Tenacibaculum tangerinum]WGH74154.1 contractile injection system tape measure protein [Tenacibaculum tangerinum]
MMHNQKHSIEKVVVEVHTKSKKVAETYKNSIEHFLQEEVFPEIEKHFNSLEIEGEIGIQQIQKLNIEVGLSNSYKSMDEAGTKRAIKEQLLTKLKNIFKQPEAHDVTVNTVTISQSHTDAFFHFLQHGTTAWWNQNDEKNLTKKRLFEITENQNFEKRFLKALNSSTQKQRLLRQFTKDELQILFLGILNKPKGYSAFLEAIKEFSFTSQHTKNRLWQIFIAATLHHNFSEVIATIQEEMKTVKNTEASNDFSEELSNFLQELISKEQLFKNQVFKNKKEDVTTVATLENKNTTETDEATCKLKEESGLKQLEDSEKNHKKTNIPQEKSAVSQEKNTTEKTLANTRENKTTTIDDASKMSKESKEKTVNNSTENQSITNKEINKNSEKETRNNNSNTTGKETNSQQEKTKNQSTTEEASEHFNDNEQRNSLTKETSNDYKKAEYRRRLQEALHNNLTTTNEVPNDTTSHLVKNAGLILLHPFLKQFFTVCGFLDEKNTIIKPNEAVHLLHYVATKKEQQFENNLIFEKFLCNIPIQYPIERNIVLSDELKEKSEELLRAVLQNWNVLKNSSTDLLRNEFLQREGKLDLTKEQPRIIVESKTQDILLQKLHWNISMIKLPWIPSIVFIEW